MMGNNNSNYSADRIKALVLDRIRNENNANLTDINSDNNLRLNLSAKQKKFNIELGNISRTNEILATVAGFVILLGVLLTPFLLGGDSNNDNPTASVDEYNDALDSDMADTDESNNEEIQESDKENDEIQNSEMQRYRDPDLKSEDNAINSTTGIDIEYEQNGIYEPFKLSQEENQIAKELFHHDYENAAIYSPFHSVTCMQEYNGRPESFTLWFDFGSNDILPNFDAAEITLYDLTTKEEVSSIVLDYRISAYQYEGKKELRHTGELDIDPSKMVTGHRYFISFNHVKANDTQIDNLQFIFAFISGASFQYLDYNQDETAN